MTIGNKEWAITEGWIPPLEDETVAFLNFSFQEAHVEIMVYYSTRDPVGPYRLAVPAGQLRHVCFNCLKDPEPIPRATDYACTIESNVPIVVQHLGARANASPIYRPEIVKRLQSTHGPLMECASDFSPVGAEHAIGCGAYLSGKEE
jgi:hypothetical protein